MRRSFLTSGVCGLPALFLGGSLHAWRPDEPSRSANVSRRDVVASSGSWLELGAPQLRSADAMAFAPDGTLLVGDSRGSAVYALDVGDSGNADSTDVTVPNIDEKVAARLGIAARDLAVHDMVVHPRSHNVYLSVARGRRADAAPVIVRIGKGSRIDVVDLSAIRFAKTDLPRALSADSASDETGRNWTISDMTVLGNELFVAGLSNEEFSSTLRRIPLPFTSKVTTTGLRLYHSHHLRYETQAPATALTSYTRFGRRYLIASYGCTPIVLFPVDSLTDGAKVTGKTIAELGAGQHVRDLVVFDYQGHRYLAISNSRRSLQLMDASNLWAAAPLDEHSDSPLATAGPGMGPWVTWGMPVGVVAQMGVLHLTDFDAEHALAVQRDTETGALDLRPLAKPILWP